MFNPDDLEKLIESFIKLAGSHPWLSVPVLVCAIGLALSIGVKTAKEHFGWVVDVIKGGTRQQRIKLGATFAAVLLAAIVAPVIVTQTQKTKPVFIGIEREVMTKEFTARWMYADEKNGSITYRLVARNNGETEQDVTTIPYHRVNLTGPVTLQVTATLPDGSTRTSSEVRTEIYRDSIDRLIHKGHLVVGIHADDAPGVFCYSTPDSGYQGFDIDFSKIIARKLAAKYMIPYRDPEVVFYHWPELLDQPAKHHIDYAIASISRIQERERRYGIKFTDPYYRTVMGVIRITGNDRDIIPLKRLKLMKLASNRFTTTAAVADRYQLDSRRADTKQEVFALLADGTVEGVLYDYARGIVEAKQRGWHANRIDFSEGGKKPPPDEEYAIAVAPVNERLRLDINDVIRSLDTNRMITTRIENFQRGSGPLAEPARAER